MMIAAIILSVIITSAPCAPRNYELPGGYAGRPPSTQHWPGRCWCQFHGPRGGCTKWICKPK